MNGLIAPARQARGKEDQSEIKEDDHLPSIRKKKGIPCSTSQD